MDDLRDRLARSLDDRYELEDEVGRGGMAIVFRAEDRKHGRKLAVKVLRPELAAAMGAERFLRETRIAAQLQHPHIVPVYDSGEGDGVLYYLMPFITGESLGARLRREGPLPVGESLRIAVQVADALEHAHAVGVIHRDIKPDNIMLSSGHALITDFGIATALDAAAGTSLTQTGTSVGTPKYMSPEQVNADPDLDGRADIYSLACVLYEALGGRPPYEGATPLAIMAKQARGAYPKLAGLRADLPTGVEEVIAKALSNDAGRRHARVGEFAQALRDASGAGSEPRQPKGGRSIAVLPFANTSADPENEYFSDGMTEEIISALAKLQALEVAARTSCFAFKGRDVDLRVAGETLGVTTVMEGSVRQAGNRLRVTARLVDVRSGFQLWSERYDREMTDVFAIQDELAAAIVRQLELQLTPVQVAAPLLQRGTHDLEAYDLYLRGRHAWERRDLKTAVACLEGAIARDPNYALALAGLADAYSLLGFHGFIPPLVARAKATEAASRAITADPTVPEGHFATAMVSFFYEYDVKRSVAAIERGLGLGPSSALTHALACQLYGTVGRLEELAAHSDRALALDPLSAHVHHLAAGGHMLAGDPDRGVELCLRALELDPRAPAAMFVLGFAYAVGRDYEQSAHWFGRAAEALGGSPMAMTGLGWSYALAGRREEAEAILARLAAHSQEPYGTWIEAALGDFDAAFRSLEPFLEQRTPMGLYVVLWSGWAELRADPRYAEVMKRVGLGHLL